MGKKRTTAITVMGILMVVFMVVFFILFLLQCFIDGGGRIFFMAMTIFWAIAAYGVLTLRRWARTAVLSSAAFMVIIVGGALIGSHFTNDSEAQALIGLVWLLSAPFIIFGVSCIYYFTRPPIKELFR